MKKYRLYIRNVGTEKWYEMCSTPNYEQLFAFMKHKFECAKVRGQEREYLVKYE